MKKPIKWEEWHTHGSIPKQLGDCAVPKHLSNYLLISEFVRGRFLQISISTLEKSFLDLSREWKTKIILNQGKKSSFFYIIHKKNFCTKYRLNEKNIRIISPSIKEFSHPTMLPWCLRIHDVERPIGLANRIYAWREKRCRADEYDMCPGYYSI